MTNEITLNLKYLSCVGFQTTLTVIVKYKITDQYCAPPPPVV